MFATIAHVIEYLGLTPTHLLAAGLGLVVTWGATQAAKKNIGLSGPRAAGLALLIGFVVTYTIAPGWGWTEAWLAVAVGLVAPAAYKMLITFAAGRWAWARSLSGDPE